MKNIIVYDNSGHPFQVQLSRALAANGHNVLHLYSASFQTPKGNLCKLESDPKTFNIKGISLSSKFEKYSFIKRWQQENFFGKLVNEEILKFNPDIVIASNVPLDTLKHIQKFCEKKRIELIFWVQDFYGIAIKNILKFKLYFIGTLIGNYYTNMEKTLLNKSNHIVLITNHFSDVLRIMNVENKNYTVIPNWAPIKELSVEEKKNSWSVENNLHDKFCFMYTGTLGLKHRPELLVRLSEKFISNPNVRVIVISEGLGADWLKKQRDEKYLNNLLIMDFQPYELLPKTMGTADVLISILEKKAGVYSVPSKILSYMCAKRALLLSVPEENLASLMVKESDSGFVANPDDEEGFLNLALRLFEDEDLRNRKGINARKYAEKYFDISSITEKFEEIINTLE